MQRESHNKILIVGDSIAERWTRLAGQIGKPVENWGASGDKPENLLWRLRMVEGRRYWSTVILIVGINSAFRSPYCTTVAASIEADFRDLKRISPASKFVVIGVMPYTLGLRASLPQIEPINAVLAFDARRLGYNYVDANYSLIHQCLDKAACPLLIDWLHPSDNGYAAIWAAVKTQAATALK